MFGIDSSEFLLIAVVALLVIGPKDLPRVMRLVGGWVGRGRAMTRHLRAGFDTMMREAELDEMQKQWAKQNADIMAATAPAAVGPHAYEAPAAAFDAATAPHAADVVVGDHPYGHPASTAVEPTAMTGPQPFPHALAAEPAIPLEPAPDGAAVSEIDDSKAPLMDHLIELRKRLLVSIVALVVAFGIAFTQAKEIFAFLVQPLVRAENGHHTQLIYTKLYEKFFVDIKVAAFAALCLAFPVIANQLWAFVAPGLYRNEKRAFLPFLIMTPVLFTMGAALAYYVVAPISFRFLINFGADDANSNFTSTALPTMDSYLSLIMHFMAGFGISFLLPILLMLLERAGIVTRTQLKAARRYAIVGAFVVAAVLAPPDVASQALLALPLIALYEASIIGIWFSERKRVRNAQALPMVAE